MSSNDASSELSRSAEIESEYSFLAAIYSLMLISELCALFEEHLKLAESKETSKKAKDVAKNIIGRTKTFPFSLLKNNNKMHSMHSRGS